MNGRIKKQSEQPFSLPRIGMIKVGTKVSKDGGKEFPTSLDYFVATGNYAENFKQAFGDKPTKIPLIFVSEDTQSVCYERFEAWSNDGKKLGFGDGVTFTIFDESKNDYVENVEAEDPRVQKLKPQFKRILTLKFVIPAIKGIYGHWEFSTRANKSSINQIIAIFDHVKETAGRVSAIPFDLMVTMVNSRKPKELKKYPVVSLIPNIGAENLEKISAYLGDLNFGKIGILTDAKIEQLSKSLPESPEPTNQLPEPKIEDAQIIEEIVVKEEPKAKKSKVEKNETEQLDGELFN